MSRKFVAFVRTYKEFKFLYFVYRTAIPERCTHAHKPAVLDEDRCMIATVSHSEERAVRRTAHVRELAA
jgi:hypothetical protein